MAGREGGENDTRWGQGGRQGPDHAGLVGHRSLDFLITALLTYNLPAIQSTHFNEGFGFYTTFHSKSLRGH